MTDNGWKRAADLANARHGNMGVTVDELEASQGRLSLLIGSFEAQSLPRLTRLLARHHEVSNNAALQFIKAAFLDLADERARLLR